MKILGLQAENIKKLVAVDIAPEGNLIKISGKNGAGKSSLLDAIFWACAGTENIQEKPIRNGETKAFIKLSLGENDNKVEYIVERKFVKKEDGEETSQLTISSPEGARFPSPQTMLDKFLGAITFDPLEFAKMDSKKQYEAIRTIAGVKYDFEKADAENKRDFQERTIINRDIKALEAQIKDIAIPELEVNEPIDVSAVVKELNDIKAKKTTFEDLDEQIKEDEAEIADADAQIEQLKKEIENLEGDKKTLLEKVKKSEIELTELHKEIPKEEYITTLEEKISNSTNINSAISEKKHKEQQKEQKQTELKDKNSKADKLTQAMEARKADAKKAVEEAKMPVKGLQLKDGEVWFGDVPFSQCSSAEQLRISTAIAMSSNPKLRVIRIKEGALLDDDSLKIIEEMANDNDFQIWIELVGDKEMSIVIDNGKVRKKA